MKRKHKIILTVFVCLVVVVFAIRSYNRWHYREYEANKASNHSTMKWFVEDNEEYIRFAFNKLETMFTNVNDFEINSYSVRKKDTLLNGLPDTLYTIYFTYSLYNDKANNFFSKISVLDSTATVLLHRLDTKTNDEYAGIKSSRKRTEKETMESIKETIRQLPDTTRKRIADTLTRLLTQ